ncbi:DUF6435 family protein [Marinobacter sp. AL4B]|uniref:DUF6435 family protein n=1 Tax=Marinobacter sp. AL4B TaxID=2871173 RepID=UPI001CAA4D67|nr:DUF6435 family protein [Marinobacter sp. AL4B]MBZ0332881.1 DUF6435 family protein [Marinobacter sp. AL4B]
MLPFFKKDPAKKLKKQYSTLLERAMKAQRNGDIRTYSELSAEAAEVFKQIQQIESPNT